MMKIAVYGGSFDPPHKGHRLLADNLADFCGVEKVLIIPTAMSPFKQSSGASPEDRLSMCELAFNSPLFEVSDVEISRGGKSYTVDTLRQVKKLYPESDLYLFMGDDMLLSLDRWYCYEEILSLCTVVAACRTEKLDKLQEMRDYVQARLGTDKVKICTSVPVEVSSTLVREHLRQGDFFGLEESVCEYIRARGLYK